MELPDFHIPHAEKIEWMIDTAGWAYEAVRAEPESIPPRPSYGYTIGVPDLVGYPDISLFGLTPSAGHGLLQMVIGLLLGGTELPIGPELVGVLDHDLRCRFVPLAPETANQWMPVARAWYRGAPQPAVQLLYPDRGGALPYESDFDQRLKFAQPVLGSLDEPTI